MRESFIHEVFILLYGDEYIYEGYSYGDAIKKIKSLIKESEESNCKEGEFCNH